MNRVDSAWREDALVRTFLESIRGAVPAAKEQIEVMMKLVGAMERPVGRFLDLGCGDGILAWCVLESRPEARAVLLDFSTPMLKAARKRFECRKDGVELVEGDFATPAWLKEVRSGVPFDLVVSGLAIHHQPEARKRELFKEIFSILTPGGLFINMDHVAPRSGWARDIFHKEYVDSLYRLHRSRGTEETYEEVRDKFHARTGEEADMLSTVEDQCAWMRDSGFMNVDCYFKYFELAVFAGTRP